jgi:nicotinate phosphoribosyltransferase
MAHSYVCAFPHEIDAFRAFVSAFPSRAILLLDTYDTVAAAHKAVQVARELEARGERLAGVRLDSGDLVALSRAVRSVLDTAGLDYVQIFASGNLDEYAIERCTAADAPIDAYGVGTRMTVSADAPYLDMAYKLVRYAGRDVLKTSPGKETWTGEKQILRRRTTDGRSLEYVLALREEPVPPGADLLLETVMEGGRLVRPLPPLRAVRTHCAQAIRALPEAVRRLTGAARYPVTPSNALAERQRTVKSCVITAEAVGLGQRFTATSRVRDDRSGRTDRGDMLTVRDL